MKSTKLYRLVPLIPSYHDSWANKDGVQLLYALSKTGKFETLLVTFNNDLNYSTTKKFTDVKIITQQKPKRLINTIKILYYLLCNSKSIDVLFQFHISWHSLLFSFFYKTFGKGMNTILELGVGTNSYFHKQNRSYRIVGFDIFEPSLKKAKAKGIIDDYFVGNVNEIDNYFEENSFDLVCAFDLIEHLNKDDGVKLIHNMERIAKKRAVIYTPNGFLYQTPSPENPFQEHLSGWTFGEMRKLGYDVIGFNGYKKLKGMYANPIMRPYFLFNFLSFMTEILLQKLNKNDLQYALLCVKDIKTD